MFAALLVSAVIFTSPHGAVTHHQVPKHHHKAPTNVTVCFNVHGHKRCTTFSTNRLSPVCRLHQKSHKKKPCRRYYRPMDRVLPSGAVVIG